MKRNNIPNRFGRTNVVNWATLWGLIFAMIALDLYTESRKHRDEQYSQLVATSRRIDSLQTLKRQLARQLYSIRAELDQCQAGAGQAGSASLAASR